MFVVIVAIFIIVIILVFVGHGVSTINLERDNKRAYEECCKNQENWVRNTAQKNDYYYDPVCKSFDPTFYSDGSVRVDHYTRKTYKKGEYMCDSHGNNCQWKKAGPDVKRPPSE